MIRLKIDDVACELEWEASAPVIENIYDLAATADPESARTGRSIVLRLPSTPRNDALMGQAMDPYAGERFNSAYHEGVVEADGTELLRGAVHLTGVTSVGGATTYTVRITGGAGEWAEHAARTRINSMLPDYSFAVSGENIQRSWSDDGPVRMLPVHRDEYRAAYSSTSIYPPQRMMSAADYHPFIRIEPLVRAAIAESGYELRSDFMAGEEFGSLCMSGRMAAVSTAGLLASMGFCAGRTSEAAAEADSLGRVYLSPLVLTHSLGNVVQTTDAAYGDAAGEELYNRNGVVSINEEGVRFTPVATVTAGFELRLAYTTDYRILSRERLEGFDAVYVDAGCDIAFRLANPFVDRRATLVPNTEYTCIVFDHAAGAAYRIVCRYADTQSVIASCELQVRGADGSYVAYTGDWALYDGHVGETGRTEVEITLTTPPERITPSSPKRFTRMYLHGAREGQSVTLAKRCTLKPAFSAAPAEGSVLRFADMAGFDSTQADLLAALQQMYNLRIYTDARRRRVYIEPYDTFFRSDVHDWSDRIDYAQPIEVSDMAADVHELRTLAYLADGGGAVARFEREQGERLGEWSFRTPSRIALQGERRTVNGMFCATLNASGVHASAPSASVVETGDRDADGQDTAALRVVSYRGLRPLPEGERWGYPSYERSYPFAAFHCGAETGAASGVGPFTLCFEDRDGAAGLHTRYDTQWRVEGFRQYVSATVALDPDELETLIDLEGEGPDIRSLFRFYVGGQSALYRLRAVESYDTAHRTARCTFFRAECDRA